MKLFPAGLGKLLARFTLNELCSLFSPFFSLPRLSHFRLTFFAQLGYFSLQKCLVSVAINFYFMALWPPAAACPCKRGFNVFDTTTKVVGI